MSEVGLFNYEKTFAEMRENNERFTQLTGIVAEYNESTPLEELKQAFKDAKKLFKQRKLDGGIADAESVITLKLMSLLMQKGASIAELVRQCEAQS